MIAFLTYDLKVAVLIAVFYMFYRLLLSRETFHQVNRVVLLTTAVASFILPLCIVTLHKTVVIEPVQTLVSIDGMSAVLEEEPKMPMWQMIGIALFIAGMVATAGYTLLSMLKVWGLVRGSEQHPQTDGIVVCDTTHKVSPFSWLRYIVLSHDDYMAQDAAVIAHERGHICQHHTLDLLLVDTLTALQWFNPAMWMLRQDLRAIHEYEADAAVLSQGINMRQYQYLLIQKAVSDCGYSVVNGITHSTLKNRISMMSHKKSSSASLLKLLAFVPIVGVALALNAETVNDYVYADKPEAPQKKIVKKGKKAGQVKLNAKTIEVQADKDVVTGENVTVEMNDGSTIEELIKRMPGAEVDENGNITMNGKQVKKILVDGKEFKLGDKQESNDWEKNLIFLGEQFEDADPLIVIDGKVSTSEQLKALDQKKVDNITVLKNEEVLKVYAKHFDTDTSNGILFINTKEYVKNGKKEIVSVDVKAKKPQEEAAPEGAFDIVEHMPEFPGGVAEMMKFLATNIKYPEEAYSKGIEGRVLVQFIIEKDGSISGVKVVKKVNDALDTEAIRVVENMPKWKPGKQNGMEVRVKYTIPVTFRLS